MQRLTDLSDEQTADLFVLAKLEAAEGQHVLAGEPLGRGPAAGENGKATIYIELRRNGVPVDPAKWFVPAGANG